MIYKLFTSNEENVMGEFVATVKPMVFQMEWAPPVLFWGTRVFIHVGWDTYREVIPVVVMINE